MERSNSRSRGLSRLFGLAKSKSVRSNFQEKDGMQTKAQATSEPLQQEKADHTRSSGQSNMSGKAPSVALPKEHIEECIKQIEHILRCQNDLATLVDFYSYSCSELGQALKTYSKLIDGRKDLEEKSTGEGWQRQNNFDARSRCLANSSTFWNRYGDLQRDVRTDIYQEYMQSNDNARAFFDAYATGNHRLLDFLDGLRRMKPDIVSHEEREQLQKRPIFDINDTRFRFQSDFTIDPPATKCPYPFAKLAMDVPPPATFARRNPIPKSPGSSAESEEFNRIKEIVVDYCNRSHDDQFLSLEEQIIKGFVVRTTKRVYANIDRTLRKTGQWNGVAGLNYWGTHLEIDGSPLSADSARSSTPRRYANSEELREALREQENAYLDAAHRRFPTPEPDGGPAGNGGIYPTGPTGPSRGDNPGGSRPQNDKSRRSNQGYDQRGHTNHCTCCPKSGCADVLGSSTFPITPDSHTNGGAAHCVFDRISLITEPPTMAHTTMCATENDRLKEGSDSDDDPESPYPEPRSSPPPGYENLMGHLRSLTAHGSWPAGETHANPVYINHNLQSLRLQFDHEDLVARVLHGLAHYNNLEPAQKEKTSAALETIQSLLAAPSIPLSPIPCTHEQVEPTPESAYFSLGKLSSPRRRVSTNPTSWSNGKLQPAPTRKTDAVTLQEVPPIPNPKLDRLLEKLGTIKGSELDSAQRLSDSSAVVEVDSMTPSMSLMAPVFSRIPSLIPEEASANQGSQPSTIAHRSSPLAYHNPSGGNKNNAMQSTVSYPLLMTGLKEANSNVFTPRSISKLNEVEQSDSVPSMVSVGSSALKRTGKFRRNEASGEFIIVPPPTKVHPLSSLTLPASVPRMASMDQVIDFGSKPVRRRNFVERAVSSFDIRESSGESFETVSEVARPVFFSGCYRGDKIPSHAYDAHAANIVREANSGRPMTPIKCHPTEDDMHGVSPKTINRVGRIVKF